MTAQPIDFQPGCPSPDATCGIFANHCVECPNEWCEKHSPEAQFADAIECPAVGTICPSCRDDHEAVCSACAEVRQQDYLEEQAVARWKGEL